MPRLLSEAEVTRQLTELEGWHRQGNELRRTVTLDSFTDAISVVDAVADEAEQMDHHPDIDIRWRTLTFVLSTHSEGGITQYDIELAHRIEAIVSEALDGSSTSLA
jgi:4a-hydroxytetrahydrobiopterin dehydratase